MTMKKLRPNHRFMKKDGFVLAVLRPADPAKALARAKQILKDSQSGAMTPECSQKEFAHMLMERAYTYEGIAGIDGKSLYDTDGKAIDTIRPGDSFVPYDQVLASFERQESTN